MIKLIVSDIDGTLLPYGKTELDAELFSLIRRLRERGVIFCPASGRNTTPCARSSRRSATS